MLNFIKENWISLISLIVSIIGFFKDNIKDMIRHCKKVKENKKAKIIISYRNEKLIITNKGHSNARNVKIFIDDKEIEKNEIFGTFARDMNFSLLCSNNSFEIKITQCLSTKRSFYIKVFWDDDNSKNNQSENIINT